MSVFLMIRGREFHPMAHFESTLFFIYFTFRDNSFKKWGSSSPSIYIFDVK